MAEISAHRTSPDRGGFDWTRRAALGGLAAVGVVAALPVLPRAAGAGTPQDAFHEICLEATKTASGRRLGAACADTRGAAAIEAALRARLPRAATRAEWTAALLARARQDLAADDRIEVEGLSLTRTEAEVLALGACLRAAASEA